MKAQNRELKLWYNWITTGSIKLPEFQRYEAWDKRRICWLLKSILHQLPMWITLILWVWDKEKFKSRYIETSAPTNPQKVTEHLLDWQQRLTSFWRLMNNNYQDNTYFVFCPELCDNEDRINWYQEKNINELEIIWQTRWMNWWKPYPLWADNAIEIIKRWLVPTNLLSPWIEFNEVEERIKKWLSVIESKVGDDIQKHKAYIAQIDKWKSHILKLRELINYYNLPYLELNSSTDKDVALQVFINMNTSGKPLSMYDIIVAEVEQEAWESLHDMQTKLDEKNPLIKNYWDLPFLILNTSALLQDKMPNNKWLLEMNKPELIKNWEEMEIWLSKMSEFLKDEKIYNKSKLPTNAVLSVIAAIFPLIWNKSDEIGYGKTLLRRYLRLSFFTDRYDNSTASAAYYDYINMKKVILKQKKDNGELYTENDIPIFNKEQYPIIDFEELISAWWPKKEWVRARGILALSLRFWAIDFATTDIINETNILLREYHHIFPQALLKEVWLNPDLALNCMLISKPTNREIWRKDPIRYLSEKYEITSKEEIKMRLESHIINIKDLEDTNYDNLSLEDKKNLIKTQYEIFLKNRAKLIHKVVKRLCDWENIYNISDVQEEMDITSWDKRIKPWSHYGNELVLKDTIAECEEYIHLIDNYFNDKWIEFLYEWINPKKLKEILILSTPRNINETTRNNFKNFRKELSEKYSITVEWRCMIEPKHITENHDRYLLSQNKSFLFTSPDVIARWQNSHIIPISDLPDFNKYRDYAVDLIHDRNKIKEFQEKFKK